MRGEPRCPAAGTRELENGDIFNGAPRSGGARFDVAHLVNAGSCFVAPHAVGVIVGIIGTI